MPDPRHNLAIECSGRRGSVTLGLDDAIIETAAIPEQRRHTVELMPTIDALFQKHALTPRDLAEVYLSIGPGSFTGLRIGVAAARMLALTLGVRIAAVPTLDVLVRNAPPEFQRVAPCLALKSDRVYAGVFRRCDQGWHTEVPPALVTLEELLSTAKTPVALLGDPLPPHASFPDDAGVTVLPIELATPRSEVVWELGHAMARRGEFADAAALVPLYIRPPEAVELWDRRHQQP